jgi:hypothetical protein
MKLLYSLCFVLLTSISFAQTEKIVCGQVPMLKTDTEAAPITNFDARIKESINWADRSNTKEEIVFKAYVDCNGDVIKFKIENSNLDDAAKKIVSEIVENSQWTAAKLDGKFVTTIVFISTEISDGVVKTVTQ